MNLAREWTAFAGASFILMGASLFAAAERKVGDILSWERQWRAAVGAPEPGRDEAPRRRRLTRAYRVGGLAFAVLGLVLAGLAAAGRTSFAVRGDVRETRYAGVLLLAIGAVIGVNAWSRRSRAPRFLAGELLGDDSPRPAGERLADICVRALIVLFVGFGVRLLREGFVR